MNDKVVLPFDFIEKYVRFTKPEYIQIYLYMKYCFEKSGAAPSAADTAKALDISPGKVEFVTEYWISCGEIQKNDGGKLTFTNDKSDSPGVAAKPHAVRPRKAAGAPRIKSTRPSYSQSEIEAVAKANKQISGMFYQAETILNKALTETETELLFSFNDWLGLPVEVITMLLSYAAKKGKTTKRYLETVAIDWAEKGIDTFEAAEAYISELEAADSAETQVRKILGIHNRGLTATEKKYIKLWVGEMKIPTELISLAYDRTVEYTGKLSWSYMDKLLQSWVANGYTNEADVRAADEEFHKNNTYKKPSKTKASPFNNYAPESKTDYSDLEEHILDMMLDDDFE